MAALRFAVQELDVQKVHLVPARLARLALLSLEPPRTLVVEKKNHGALEPPRAFIVEVKPSTTKNAKKRKGQIAGQQILLFALQVLI